MGCRLFVRSTVGRFLVIEVTRTPFGIVTRQDNSTTTTRTTVIGRCRIEYHISIQSLSIARFAKTWYARSRIPWLMPKQFCTDANNFFENLRAIPV